LSVIDAAVMNCLPVEENSRCRTVLSVVVWT
jgi:hypothetical protein